MPDLQERVGLTGRPAGDWAERIISGAGSSL
jgi:hypothetical protein